MFALEPPQEIWSSYSQSVVQIPECSAYLTVQLNPARRLLNSFYQQSIMLEISACINIAGL